MPRDPRWYLIAALLGLVAYGNAQLGAPVALIAVALIFTVALCTQYLGTALSHARFDAKSAIASGLLLCLLLRADEPSWLALGAFLAVASKFLVRWNGKHVVNPAVFGAAAVLYAGRPHVWVSLGQWGHTVPLALVLIACGGAICWRAGRAGTALAFLAVYALLQVLSAAALGGSAAAVVYGLRDGTLLIVAFFLVPDPKTTPDHPLARGLFAAWVAALGCVFQLWLAEPYGLFYALALVSIATPWLDTLFRGERYQWPGAKAHQEDDCAATHALPGNFGGLNGGQPAPRLGVRRLLRRQG